jgi:hypothetical protein
MSVAGEPSGMQARMTGASTESGRGSEERIDVTDVPADQVQAYAGTDTRPDVELFLERRGTRTYLVTDEKR